ncbi:MAG TPA: nuclear transport factor 2 family protein [Gaiellaceae bacterium]|jgi:uncharacterized protein (TIGR02246 family)
MADASGDPARIVLDMVDAYNARDLDRTVEYFADDAVFVNAEGAVTETGKAAIRDVFDDVFSTNPELRADVPTTICVGDWVMIHSIVEDWVHRDGTHARMEWVELYHVAAGKIDRMQLFA